MINTPLALFIFNRPETTAEVFAVIRQVRPSTFLVIADGARISHPDDVLKCSQSRDIINQVDWPCRILKNFSEDNLGCKLRVSSGLDWVFSLVEEAIILEDDCLPDPSFFSFCEHLLEYYRDDERVMMISGTNYLQDRLIVKESYCFSRYFAIWGWASWRRAWKHYDLEMTQWPRFKKENHLYGLYSQRYMRSFLSKLFDATYSGYIDTWDSQWFFACLFNNGLSIVPKKNLISNIGSFGVHSSSSSSNHFFPTFTINTDDLIHPEYVTANQLYDSPFFVEQFRFNLLKKLKNALLATSRLFRKFLSVQ